MTQTLQNTLSSPSTGYSVFESSQVLSSDQLNSLATYVNYQQHLTRVGLLGVGIVGGLQVMLRENMVTVRKGAGVTTDGDLLMLPDDMVFDKFRLYGPAAPRYAPFYVGETMRTVFELVAADSVDEATAPLASLPVTLAEMVVVMFMERYEDDPDLCSGTDCDNLGKTVFDTPRLMLVSRGDASALLKVPMTVSQAAVKLPVLLAARPAVSRSIVSATDLARVYRESCASTHTQLIESFDTLKDQLPMLVEQFDASSLRDQLTKHQSQFSGNGKPGIQDYYDFLKDVVDTWNELREALLDDDSLLCPDLDAFPRHLILGDLTNPAEFRTGLYPSPLISSRNKTIDHARFLVRRLSALITGFSLPSPNDVPAETRLRVTPSRSEVASLEERAIPWYYPKLRPDDWSFRSARHGAATDIHGYHTSGSEAFRRQIGRCDFFRVEGHQGQNVRTAVAAVESMIASFNLPFTVRAVLLHPDRKKIVIRPAIRYSDLHRLHHLLRKDLSTQLAETKTFNGAFRTQIDAAVLNKTITDRDVGTQSALVRSAAERAEPALAKSTFTEYQQTRNVQDWREGYKTVINVANSFRGTLSDVTRSNYTTAFDSLLTNNHPAWLEWLESLMQSKDDQEDNKLLFSKFVEQHPGLEHFGGVIRGGTLVLVYDDQARVVADFMLSYNWSEAAEEEPKEPEQLSDPTYKMPDLFLQSVKVLPALDTKFDQRFSDFATTLKGTLLKDQADIQFRQLDFLKQSIQLLGNKATVVTPGRQFENPLLNSLLSEVDSKQRQVEDLRGVIADPATHPDIRTKSQSEVIRVEKELADAITSSSNLLVQSNISMDPGTDGGAAIVVISRGVDKIVNTDLRTQLGKIDAAKFPQIGQIFK